MTVANLSKNATFCISSHMAVWVTHAHSVDPLNPCMPTCMDSMWLKPIYGAVIVQFSVRLLCAAEENCMRSFFCQVGRLDREQCCPKRAMKCLLERRPFERIFIPIHSKNTLYASIVNHILVTGCHDGCPHMYYNINLCEWSINLSPILIDKQFLCLGLWMYNSMRFYNTCISKQYPPWREWDVEEKCKYHIV